MSRRHHQLNARRWAEARRATLDRDGWRCCQCGRAGRLEVDHRVPLAQGGAEFDPANLQSLCRGCHLSKSAAEREAKLPADVRAWQAFVRDRA